MGIQCVTLNSSFATSRHHFAPVQKAVIGHGTSGRPTMHVSYVGGILSVQETHSISIAILLLTFRSTGSAASGLPVSYSVRRLEIGYLCCSVVQFFRRCANPVRNVLAEHSGTQVKPAFFRRLVFQYGFCKLGRKERYCYPVGTHLSFSVEPPAPNNTVDGAAEIIVCGLV